MGLEKLFIFVVANEGEESVVNLISCFKLSLIFLRFLTTKFAKKFNFTNNKV